MLANFVAVAVEAEQKNCLQYLFFLIAIGKDGKIQHKLKISAGSMHLEMVIMPI